MNCCSNQAAIPIVPMNKPKSNPLDSLLASLYGRINYERQLKVTPRHFKLKNMSEFLRRLGDPHLQYPVVHVAGTKGKGSVATMVGQILLESGRRTGVYVSPHLESINQRMIINGTQITDEQLVETLTKIEPIADKLDQESDDAGRRKLTFFEVTTAAAFYFFAQQNAEAVVLEVGLGGRMDSTNVCQPLVSVITNISFDHTRQLGSTLDKIAGEKAGIIKPGVQVISGALAAEAATVIADVAKQNNSPLALLNRDFRVLDSEELHHQVCEAKIASPATIEPSFDGSRRFGVQGQIGDCQFELHDLQLKLIGRHQQTNAAIAVVTVQSLNQHGWKIDDQAIRAGLANSRLAGRTEVMSRRPAVILDIAHNVASVAALVETLKDLPEWNASRRKTLIIAVSREKDTAGILNSLVDIFDRIIVTKYQNNPRGKPARELLEIATAIAAKNSADLQKRRPSKREHCDQPGNNLDHSIELMIEPTPIAAWRMASQNLTDDHLVCIAGSAFLVAELRPIVQQWLADIASEGSQRSANSTNRRTI